MADVRLPYVDAQRDRSGRVRYYYFRRAGIRQRLPGEAGSVEFAEAYQALLTTKSDSCSDPATDRRDYRAGTFGALANDYLGSATFREKAASTQALYRRILDKLSAENGPKPVRLLKRRHIRRMRDAMSDTPGAANNVLRLFKIVLNFAVEEELIDVNPAARMKELKGGEYRSWTDDECATFEKRWAPGTMERRAYAIALYTGQRRADQVAMTRAHRKNGVIQVSQGKTGENLWIAEHGALTTELALGEQSHMSLLTTSKGKAFDPVYYGAWFADAIFGAGLPDDCVLHGLRKCAARKLAEAGCSESEIQSITGHRTSAMVAHYVKDVNKKRQASAAILKLESTK
jgi:integrase